MSRKDRKVKVMYPDSDALKQAAVSLALAISDDWANVISHPMMQESHNPLTLHAAAEGREDEARAAANGALFGYVLGTSLMLSLWRNQIEAGSARRVAYPADEVLSFVQQLSTVAALLIERGEIAADEDIDWFLSRDMGWDKSVGLHPNIRKFLDDVLGNEGDGK